MRITIDLTPSEMKALDISLDLAIADIESLSHGGDEGRGYFANKHEINAAFRAIEKVSAALTAYANMRKERG